VTVTVTRKIVSMILSVVMFGHRLSGIQWVGVGMVFGGIGAKAGMEKRGGGGKEGGEEGNQGEVGELCHGWCKCDVAELGVEVF